VNKFRKPIILGVLGLIALYYVGDWVVQNQFEGPMEARRKKAAKLHDDIEARERDLARIRKTAQEMDIYRAQSLPSNAEVARSLYQAWLLDLVGHADFSNPNVDSNEPVNRKGLYQVLNFSFRGRGSLEQLTKFLYGFYNADHLHLIRSLTITPVQGADQLDLAISIEALVLASADRKDRLSTRRSERLAMGKLDDYQTIVQRNLFGVGGATDPTDYTYLTAVNYVDGQPEVWFTVRTSDTVLKLRKGETIDVGQFKGVVADISDADVVLESDGERWLLTIGESLAQAAALPPGL
jgi:hypothetical protein